MAVKNGTLIVLKLATEKVNGLTSNGIDFARDMIDVTTKDSTGNAKEYIPGEKGATISAEGKWDEATSNYTLTELFAAFDAGTALAFVFGGLVSGDITYSGSAYLSAFNATAPKNGEATWSATLQVTGVVTAGTVGA